MQRVVEATDGWGAVAGEFLPREIRPNGILRWGGRELTPRPAAVLRERYVLQEGERDLVLLDGKGWGRRPVKISLESPDAIDPGLLRFTAFLVHRLAGDAESAASSTVASG